MSDVDYVDEQPGAPAPAGYAPPPGYGPPQAGPPKKSSNGWVIAVVVLVAAVPLIGVFASFAIFGVARYMRNVKVAEGHAVAVTLARRVVACGEPLPPRSTPVPADPPPGRKYLSSASDWDQPAFRCGGSFTLSKPQYFSYWWEQDDASHGRIVGIADLDGDGKTEETVEVRVFCGNGVCAAAPEVWHPN